MAEPGSGLPREKSSDMAAVLMTGRDGRTALLAFTSTASLNRWAQSHAGGEARPVPVPARQAASAALQDKAAALLVDVAGPVLFVVEGEDLGSLAAGHRLVRLEDDGPGCTTHRIREFVGPGMWLDHADRSLGVRCTTPTGHLTSPLMRRAGS